MLVGRWMIWTNKVIAWTSLLLLSDKILKSRYVSEGQIMSNLWNMMKFSEVRSRNAVKVQMADCKPTLVNTSERLLLHTVFSWKKGTVQTMWVYWQPSLKKVGKVGRRLVKFWSCQRNLLGNILNLIISIFLNIRMYANCCFSIVVFHFNIS